MSCCRGSSIAVEPHNANGPRGDKRAVVLKEKRGRMQENRAPMRQGEDASDARDAADAAQQRPKRRQDCSPSSGSPTELHASGKSGSSRQDYGEARRDQLHRRDVISRNPSPTRRWTRVASGGLRLFGFAVPTQQPQQPQHGLARSGHSSRGTRSPGDQQRGCGGGKEQGDSLWGGAEANQGVARRKEQKSSLKFRMHFDKKGAPQI